MTRIISGAAGGRRLSTPSSGTRPTSDRVREALFSRIEHLMPLDGVRVLDLYAGSGALGLEALSRGAGEALLVEKARGAVGVLRRNIEQVGLRGAQVIAADVGVTVRAGGRGRVDLVLSDPPYDVSAQQVDADLAALNDGWLEPDALIVVERASRSAGPTWPEGWEALDSKRYGDTTLWFAYGPAASVGEHE